VARAGFTFRERPTRVDIPVQFIESFAGSLNCLFFAGGGDDADVHEAITLLSVNAPNGRLLPYPSHGRALF